MASGEFAPNADGIADIEDCRVLVAATKLVGMRDLLPVLEQVAGAERRLVIFAEAVEGEVLATLVQNKARGILESLAVRIAAPGRRRSDILKDSAVLTGARIVDPDLGDTLERVTLDQLGHAKRVSIAGDQVEIEALAYSTELESRLNAIRAALRNVPSGYDREILIRRYKSLAGKGAIIAIGGLTENEIADGRYDAESALHALSLATHGGVQVGGGISLLAASVAVERAQASKPGEDVGKNAIATALRAPLYQLVRSSGLSVQETTDELLKDPGKAGVEVLSGRIVPDLFSEGIIDPAPAITEAVAIAHSRVRDLVQTSAWRVDALLSPYR